MPNYRIIENNPQAGDPLAIVATGAASDGETVFGYLSEAKAAAIQHHDNIIAAIKRFKAGIRGLKEKDVRYEEEVTLADVGREMQRLTPPAGQLQAQLDARDAEEGNNADD